VTDAVAILLYHRVDIEPSPWAVTPTDFHTHLDAIAGAGFTVMSMMQLIETPVLPSRTIALTFDDGYADTVSVVAPALVDRGFGATVYVTTGADLGAADVRELAAAGIEIGAHSHSHRELDTLSALELDRELRGPKAALEDILGMPVPGVAWPHGYGGPRVRAAARHAGYEHAAAVGNRLAGLPLDVWDIARLTVTATTSADQVLAWCHGQAPGPRSAEAMKTTAWRVARRAAAMAGVRR
jgi:peptidoglycan/xylan/chitin deacetylase (PgdA/CDA1 family)